LNKKHLNKIINKKGKKLQHFNNKPLKIENKLMILLNFIQNLKGTKINLKIPLINIIMDVINISQLKIIKMITKSQLLAVLSLLI